MNLFNKLKKAFKDLPIKSKLILTFSLLIIIPVASISYLSFNKSKIIIQNKTSRYISDILDEVSKNIEFTLNDIDKFTYTIFANSYIQDWVRHSNKGFSSEYDRCNISQNIEKTLSKAIAARNDIEAISIVTKKGDIYSANLNAETYSIGKNYKRLAADGSGSLVFLGIDKNNETINLGRAINDLRNQTMIGYLFISVKESCLYNIYKNVNFSVDRNLSIIDKKGKIVSDEKKIMLDRKINSSYVKRILGNNDKGFFITKIGKEEYYIAYHTVSDLGWKAYILIPAVNYEREIIQLMNWTLMMCALTWLIAVILSLNVSSMISKPIKELAVMMKRIETGDYSARIITTSKDEVGILGEHFNMMAEKINFLIQEVYEQSIVKKDAELKSLLMQINPHFLYNTLESINWMSRAKNAPEAGIMAKALGDLMRKSISGNDFITLREEIDNINNYLIIQKYRYGDKFESVFNIDLEVLDAIVPKLILQPLVENAIIHGVESKAEPGKIIIEGFLMEEVLMISVIDDGIGIEDEALKNLFAEKKDSSSHDSIGLKNVQKRLKLYYGEEYGLEVSSTKMQGTTVFIKIPLNIKENDLSVK